MLSRKDFLFAIVVVFSLWALIGVQPVKAQGVSIPVATGSKTGSYFRFASQAAVVCQNEARINVVESAGSTANLDSMEANEVALAVSQLDILDLYKRTKDMSGIKLLVPLFPEQVHFVTRSDVMQVEGARMLFGKRIPGTGEEVQLKTVSDLAGKRVVAAGGSFKTAQVISYLGALPMNLTEAKSADVAVQALLAGQADAAILVGAQPLGTLTAMGEKMASLRLLPVSEELAAKLASVYTKAQPLTYRAMGTGGDNVRTVQVMSALVTQNYPKSPMGDAVYAFQQCLLREAQAQATVPGNHPAWRNLRMTTGVNWDAWNYVGAGAAVRPVAPVKK